MALLTLTRWYGRLFNDRVSRKLREESEGAFSRTHLLLLYEGRKTGKRYSIPVNYRRTEEGTLFIGTEAPWSKNFEGGAPVEVVIAGELHKGHARVIGDEEKRGRGGRMLSGPMWLVLRNTLTVIEVELEDDR